MNLRDGKATKGGHATKLSCSVCSTPVLQTVSSFPNGNISTCAPKIQELSKASPQTRLYCVPTSAPCRFLVVGSCILKNISSSSVGETLEGLYLSWMTSAWPVSPVQICKQERLSGIDVGRVMKLKSFRPVSSNKLVQCR